MSDINFFAPLNAHRDYFGKWNEVVGWRKNSDEIIKVLTEYRPDLVPIFKNYVVGTMIALIHSEASEMLEAARKNLMDDHLPHRKGVEVEGADLYIRLCDFFDYLKLDLSGSVDEKNDYNHVRPDHKLENRAKENG